MCSLCYTTSPSLRDGTYIPEVLLEKASPRPPCPGTRDHVIPSFPSLSSPLCLPCWTRHLGSLPGHGCGLQPQVTPVLLDGAVAEPPAQTSVRLCLEKPRSSLEVHPQSVKTLLLISLSQVL